MNSEDQTDAVFDPTRKVSLNEIEHYWQESSKNVTDSQGLKPTARDPFLQDLIEQTMLKYFSDGTNLLDIGCGEGTSTIKFANRCARVTGIDFIESYVTQATTNACQNDTRNIEFHTGDIMRLMSNQKLATNFNAVSLIRVLINLGDWKNQKQALDQVRQALQPGGLLLMSEGWAEGWDGLNVLRGRAGLKPIELVKYNTLLRKTELERYLAEHFHFVEYHSFGFYIFMSRVFQPLFRLPDPPIHLHPINELTVTMWNNGIGRDAFETCDYAGVYVFRKK